MVCVWGNTMESSLRGGTTLCYRPLETKTKTLVNVPGETLTSVRPPCTETRPTGQDWIWQAEECSLRPERRETSQNMSVGVPLAGDVSLKRRWMQRVNTCTQSVQCKQAQRREIHCADDSTSDCVLSPPSVTCIRAHMYMSHVHQRWNSAVKWLCQFCTVHDILFLYFIVTL